MSFRYLALTIVPILALSLFVGSSIAFSNSAPNSISPIAISKVAYNGTYASNISELVNSYIAPRFNSNVDLIAQGLPNDTRELGDLGVIHFENGTEAPNSTASTRFEVDCCSWKAGWGLIDNPPTYDPDMGYQILNATSSLNSTVGWHPNWVDDSVFGVPIPYASPDISIAYTLNGGTFPEFSNGTPYEIAQNSPWNSSDERWNQANLHTARGMKNTSSAEDLLYQSLNYFIRGDNADAAFDFHMVANMWNGTGFKDKNVLNGTNDFFRGEDLSLFLYVQKVLNVPPDLPNGYSLTQIESKLWSLQNSDGGIAYQYTSTSNQHSDVETSEAALLPYSPTLISYVQQIASSGEYNLATYPPSNPVIYPSFLSNQTATSTLTETITSVTTSIDVVPTTITITSTQTSTETATSYVTLTSTATTTQFTTVTLIPSTTTVTDTSVSTTTSTSISTTTSVSTTTTTVGNSRDSTVTSLSCSPATVAVKHETICTAKVTDDSPNPSLPSGTISLTHSGVGVLSNVTCSTSASTKTLTCKATFTPTSIPSGGSETISATYLGDHSHDQSLGTFKLKV